MRRFIKDYLSFNKSERNGIIILLTIILILILFLKFSFLFTNEKNINFTKFENDIDKFQKPLVIKDTIKPVKLFNDSTIPKDSIKFINFDPNNTPEIVWKQLGLSEKQVKVINNYLSKGGKFKKKEDFKKMYCIKPEQYKTLEPYIVIATKINNKTDNNFKQKTVKTNVTVEINSADTTELKKLKGIGSSYAKRIIKYRELLGGYYKKEQLLEVYGFKQDLYSSIEKYIIVDTTKIIKININSATIKDFTKCIYIKYADAKEIVKFRDKNGKFTDINKLLINNLLLKEKYEKIKPYLMLEK